MVVRPSAIESDSEAWQVWSKADDLIFKAYTDLVDLGILPEDARYLLPNATETELIMTANFREWRHIIQLRTDLAAQWEIRALMKLIWRELDVQAPHVFGDL